MFLTRAYHKIYSQATLLADKIHKYSHVDLRGNISMSFDFYIVTGSTRVVFILGWERHYAGLSDSELAARSTNSAGWAPRRRLSPDATAADSDLESVASVTSSAFSTQSERPRPTRMLRYFI